MFKPSGGMNEYLVLPREMFAFAIEGGFFTGIILVKMGVAVAAIPYSILSYILTTVALSLYSKPQAAALPGHDHWSSVGGRPSLSSRFSRPSRFISAVLLTAASIGANLALDTDPREHAYFSMSAPIVVSALFFGFEAASFALLIACIASLYFFIPPKFDLRIEDPRDIGLLCEFAAFVFLCSWILKSMFERATKAGALAAKVAGGAWIIEDDSKPEASKTSWLNAQLTLNEKQLHEAIRRHDELRHRVKNEFQAFIILAAKEADASQNPEEFHRWILRLRSAAELHNLLDDAEEAISMASYFESLSNSIMKTFDGRLAIETEVDRDICLDQQRARYLGLIYMETAINALKHAYPEGESGNINVKLQIFGNDIKFSIANDGAGFNPKSVRPGFGFLLIEESVASLGGALRWEKSTQGSSLTVTFTHRRN